MPSPPLVPDDGPIDLEHLKRMTLGDESLEREVLAMFSAQTARLIGTLAALPAEAGELAHTLKGSARAIGAFAVADAADALESALAQRRGSDGSARRADRCSDGGARGDRRAAAPILRNAIKNSPKVFRPSR